MKILCCEALASACSSKGLAQGHVEKLHFGKRKSARLSHALIAKHSRKLQGLCLRLQAATSVTHANLCRYVCTPVSPGLRWPGQAITGSWPPACFMKISHVHVCMCTNFGSDALRSWPRTVLTHTHTHLSRPMGPMSWPLQLFSFLPLSSFLFILRPDYGKIFALRESRLKRVELKHKHCRLF